MTGILHNDLHVSAHVGDLAGNLQATLVTCLLPFTEVEGQNLAIMQELLYCGLSLCSELLLFCAFQCWKHYCLLIFN
jgi:hypothetical protein